MSFVEKNIAITFFSIKPIPHVNFSCSGMCFIAEKIFFLQMWILSYLFLIHSFFKWPWCCFVFLVKRFCADVGNPIHFRKILLEDVEFSWTTRNWEVLIFMNNVTHFSNICFTGLVLCLTGTVTLWSVNFVSNFIIKRLIVPWSGLLQRPKIWIHTRKVWVTERDFRY